MAEPGKPARHFGLFRDRRKSNRSGSPIFLVADNRPGPKSPPGTKMYGIGCRPIPIFPDRQPEFPVRIRGPNSKSGFSARSRSDAECNRDGEQLWARFQANQLVKIVSLSKIKDQRSNIVVSESETVSDLSVENGRSRIRTCEGIASRFTVCPV